MSISIVIPATDKNKYFIKGDLSNWGSTSLLEWKISQAKKINKISEIYISTNSKKIKEIANYYNLKIISRVNNNSLNYLYQYSCQKVNSEFVLWLNCTFPYLSEKTINNFVNSFLKKKIKVLILHFYIIQNKNIFLRVKAPLILT